MGDCEASWIKRKPNWWWSGSIGLGIISNGTVGLVDENGRHTSYTCYLWSFGQIGELQSRRALNPLCITLPSLADSITAQTTPGGRRINSFNNMPIIVLLLCFLSLYSVQTSSKLIFLFTHGWCSTYWDGVQRTKRLLLNIKNVLLSQCSPSNTQPICGSGSRESTMWRKFLKRH